MSPEPARPAPTDGDDFEDDTVVKTVTEADFTFTYREGEPPFSFYEDENANITGWGHQDPEAFVEEVLRYDRLATGDDLAVERHDPIEVVHRWAQLRGIHPVIAEDTDRLEPCRAEDPGAVPITTLWGVR